MLQLETMMKIKILHKQGKSLRKIAQRSNVLLNTVRKYKEKQALPAYKARLLRATKIDPFKSYLQECIRIGHLMWIPAVVLMRKICLQGYTGSITQLRLYLNRLKPKASIDPFVCFETALGEQM